MGVILQYAHQSELLKNIKGHEKEENGEKSSQAKGDGKCDNEIQCDVLGWNGKRLLMEKMFKSNKIWSWQNRSRLGMTTKPRLMYQWLHFKAAPWLSVIVLWMGSDICCGCGEGLKTCILYICLFLVLYLFVYFVFDCLASKEMCFDLLYDYIVWLPNW